MKNDWKAFLTEAGAEFQDEQLLHFGNPVREREVALGGLVFADLDYLGVLAVSGSDAGDFLQSQFSNDLAGCDENTSQLSSYCTPRGRIIGLMRIWRLADTFYLKLPLDTLETVLARLRMYVMRSRVTIEDVSHTSYCLGLSGVDAMEETGKLAGKAPAADGQVLHHDGLTVIRIPGTAPRFEFITRSLAQAKACWNALNVRGAPVASAAWRLLEIQAGLPNIFAPNSDVFVPQMVNLQLVDGLSFSKGCYPGQEIVARMQYLGTLKRRMYLGRIDRDEAVSPGDELYREGEDEQSVGRIVDAQLHPDGGHLALAVLQIRVLGDSVRLDTPEGPPFVIEPLPYPFEE